MDIESPCLSGAHSTRWRTFGALLLGIVFVLAGLSKLFFLYDFRNTIDSLLAQMLSGSPLPLVLIRDALTITIPGIEIGVGFALLFSSHQPRVPAFLAAILLSVFSTLLGLLLTMDNPPSCGCFGSWEVLQADAMTTAKVGLTRNAGLLMLAVWLSMRPSELSRPIHSAGRHRRGFTLIEMLVVISIIAIIIAILLPALSLARKQGKAAQVLSAVRQSISATTQYADDEDGFLPFLGTPGQPELGIYPDGDWEFGPPSYFRAQAALWPTALLEHGIDLSNLPQFSIPEEGPKRVSTFIWMTHAAVAKPAYWVGIDPPDDPSLFSGVRLNEVMFPSTKGLFAYVGWEAGDTVTSWEVGMFDGSATLRSIIDPPRSVDGPYRRYGAIDWRVFTTYEGVLGRDY